MRSVLHRWLLPQFTTVDGVVRLRAIDVGPCVYVALATGLTVPLLHALLFGSGALQFMALLLGQLLIGCSSRVELKRAGQMLTLRRSVLGVPWLTVTAPVADASVIMTPGFSDASLTATSAAWRDGRHFTVATSNFHGVEDAQLQAWAMALSSVAT